MKSSILKVIVIFCLTFIISNGIAEASDVNIKIFINDKSLVFPDQQPYIDEYTGLTYVPVRFVSNALGAEVNWDSTNNKVIIKNSSDIIKLDANAPFAEINDTCIWVDGSARLKNGRVMVPLRFVSETLGANVKWTPMVGGGRIDIIPGSNSITQREYGLIKRVYNDNLGTYIDVDIMEMYLENRAYEEARKDGEEICNDIYSRNTSNEIKTLRLAPDAKFYWCYMGTGATTKNIDYNKFKEGMSNENGLEAPFYGYPNFSPFYLELNNNNEVQLVKMVHVP